MKARRDRVWLWAHEAGSYTGQHGLPGVSRMTPAEAAAYLSVPNVIMVHYEGRPAPPFDPLAISLRPMNQVVWSIVGARGAASSREQDEVLELAARFPNITGVIMDDFFGAGEHGDYEVVKTPGELRILRERLRQNRPRPLDLWVVLYAHQLDRPIADHLRLCDKVTFWTWQAEGLNDLEANLAKLDRLAPKTSRLLGCYMWDFAASRPMAMDLMKHQCDLALRWLHSGAIEGIILLGSPICDLQLESVEYVRRWIADSFSA